MSNIGRMPINLGSVQVNISGQNIEFKGKKASGTYVLPHYLTVEHTDNSLKIFFKKPTDMRRLKNFWGLHRALLANYIIGADVGFEKKVEIRGLGFKAEVNGSRVILSLGYTNKIDLELPKGVTLEVDKTGQILVFKGSNKELVGKAADMVRSCRPPEPYKGTGVRLADEVVIRKAGKAKGS